MNHLNALIIEDSASDTAVLQSLLDRLGVKYSLISDSRHVASVLPSMPPPHVIFLDLEMPGVDGYEVLTQIHTQPGFGHVPVVAYTANNAEMTHARAAGFHSFLGKPLRGSEFPEQFERILNDDPVWEVR